MASALATSSRRSGQSVGDRGPEVVHIGEHHPVERGGVGLDVSGHTEVDDHHRCRRWAGSQRIGQGGPVDERVGGSDGGEENVAVRQLAPQASERAGSHQGAQFIGQTPDERLGALRRPVDDDQRPHAVAGQCPDHPFTHLSRPDHDDPGTAQPSGPLAGGESHGGVGQRRDAPGDGRLRSGPLAGLDSVTEEGTEDRAGDALALRLLPGPAHLTEHLRLTDHGRVEPGGHREQVTGDVVVEADRLVPLNGGDGTPAGGRQEFLELGDSVMESLHHRVDLRAQARREDDGLGHVRVVAEPAECLLQVGIGNGDPFEQVERGVMVFETNHDHRHGEPPRTSGPRCMPHQRRAGRLPSLNQGALALNQERAVGRQGRGISRWRPKSHRWSG